ncbi:16S rRNA processing protein RimM [Candidatus Nanopelagicus limnes]|uniref:Ribosome maturation factor RimM n=1 Tax=Candidatus Nanopelagicus limnae TaxID=1884634 RepID=A0A249JXH3_9ACTN|nr:16S rRNA processing protein RimM [Candidatus Nanopelagicus limnes]
MQLVVGRIGRAHGVLGEATIEVQTDDPDIRFQIGNKLTLDDGKQLTIRSSRWHNQILLLAFDGVTDRNQIEELRDQLISSDVDLDSLAPGEYHFQQLIGCEVFQQNGELIGAVDEIVKLPGQDLLSVNRAGAQVLIPMVKQIIIEIDVLAKKIVVNPPEGLLDVAN